MPTREDRSWFVRAVTSPAFRFSVLGVVVVGLFVVFLVVGGPSRNGIEELTRSAGAGAPLVFVLLYVALTVLMFPGAVLTAAAGILFGTAIGTVLAVIGATVGAAAAFEIGRWLGRDQVEQLAGDRVNRLDDWLERRGFTAVLYLRLIPVVPFNLLNYVAGVTAITRRDHLLATVIGIVPGTFAYAALGGNLTDPTSPAFIAAVVLIVVLAVGAPLVNRALRERGKGAPDPKADDTEPTDGDPPGEQP